MVSNSDLPLVSAIVTCYNHERFVAECLNGIKDQTYRNIQVIMADDFSQDKSVEVIDHWIKANNMDCTFIRHSENKGLCKSINEALSHAAGKYVAMTSTDDVWLPDKLENQVAMMEELGDEYAVLYSDALRIDANSAPLPKGFIETYSSFLKAPSGDIFPELIQRNWIPAMTTLIRASVYKSVGTYDENLWYEDYDMWLRIARHYKFFYDGRISAKYRVIPTSMTHNPINKENSLDSLALIFFKYLGDQTFAAIFKRKLRYCLEDLYARGHKKCSPYMRHFLKHDKSAGSRFMVGCAVLGFPHPVYDFLRTRLFGIKESIARRIYASGKCHHTN